MMSKGNQNSLRLSISWSRIFPEGRGKVNQAGIDYYNKVIDCCLENDIEPNVVLFQYDLPYALALEGGWSSISVVDAFEEYARVCFEAFGDRVRLWSTLDEPQYYSYCANITGKYPPCRKLDIQSYLQWQYNLMLASAKAVCIFRKLIPNGHISVIHQDSNIEVHFKFVIY